MKRKKWFFQNKLRIQLYPMPIMKRKKVYSSAVHAQTIRLQTDKNWKNVFYHDTRETSCGRKVVEYTHAPCECLLDQSSFIFPYKNPRSSGVFAIHMNQHLHYWLLFMTPYDLAKSKPSGYDLTTVPPEGQCLKMRPFQHCTFREWWTPERRP